MKRVFWTTSRWERNEKDGDGKDRGSERVSAMIS